MISTLTASRTCHSKLKICHWSIWPASSYEPESWSWLGDYGKRQTFLKLDVCKDPKENCIGNSLFKMWAEVLLCVSQWHFREKQTLFLEYQNWLPVTWLLHDCERENFQDAFEEVAVCKTRKQNKPLIEPLCFSQPSHMSPYAPTNSSASDGKQE